MSNQSNKLTVRPAIEADISRLIMIENACFKPDLFPFFTARHFKYCLRRHTAALWVAEDNKRLVLGYVLLFFRANSRLARLYSIAVDPATHGAGIGKLLLRTAEEIALKRECQHIILEVRADSLSTINLYTQSGYIKGKLIPAYYPDGMAAVKMKKTISQ
jgi:ribosomal protein S18 acetylase RimI-like enzyme